MATADVRKILRVPGRLVANPNNYAGTFPYGGTALGLVRDAEFIPDVLVKDVTAEEWGGITSKRIYGGERAIFMAVLRQYDSDALTQIFPNLAAGVSGDQVISYNPAEPAGTKRPGIYLDDLSFRLLYAPREPTYPGILIYRAVPAVDAATRLQFSLNAEWGLAVAFVATPDSSGQVYKVGRVSDLT